MQTSEFFERFNVLYNNIMSNAAAGLDAYEVSEYLTKAQLEIVKSHFSKRGNKYLEGIDDSTKRQKDFEKLIRTASMYSSSSSIPKIDNRGIPFEVPTDVLFVLNEKFQYSKSGNVFYKVIVPLSYEEYDRLMSKPFGGPLRNQAWRLINNSGTKLYYEIIINIRTSEISQPIYYIRYVKKPNPIIVDDLSSLGDNLTIDGKSTVTECELDESLHEEILQRAVELAKASYATDQSGQAQLQNQINVGQRSE